MVPVKQDMAQINIHGLYVLVQCLRKNLERKSFIYYFNIPLSKEDAEKIKKAQKAFFEEIKKFKDSKAKDLYKELEDDAKGKLGLGIEDKDVERERIRLIIELLKVQIDVLKSELAELMKDPKANADRIEQIEKELKGLAANLDYCQYVFYPFQHNLGVCTVSGTDECVFRYNQRSFDFELHSPVFFHAFG